MLFFIFAGIGTFVWCRVRRRRLHLPLNPHEEEESIPLNLTNGHDEDDSHMYKQRKGKGRAQEISTMDHQQSQQPPIFDVGDSDEEDEDGLHKRTA